ncbi:methyl-accepting chemotaxis protein [Nitrosomonas sp. HPC101]|uniref:methyl-accepting chemotaxis protein n=1 Tax=Nitrosomonas sp. HPC101 TaxID=1658667 RepID=UPI00136B3A0B|nr:methyl-accepting chemotaxis protein [Nitrosomonas sp. HPC101]MXS84542.1 methyl-accepting chemotaxis protein [Nitrosomonas sp. HPC101]
MLQNMTIKSRLIFIVCLLSLTLVSVGSVGLYGLHHSEEKLGTIYRDRAVVLGHFSEVLDSLQQVRLHALMATSSEDVDISRQRAGQILDEDAKVTELWRKYNLTQMTPEEGVLASRFTEQWKIYQASRNQVINLALNGNFAAAMENTMQDAGPKYEAVHDTLMQLIKLQENVTAQGYADLQTMASGIFYVMITLIVLGILLAGGVGLMLIQGISRSVHQAVQVAEGIASGHLDQRIEVTGRDEISRLMQSMHRIVEVLNSFMSAQQEMSKQHDAGTISYSIPADQFPGSYGQMANSVNKLVASHIAVKMRLVEVITRYAQGDLSVEMERLPGEKAKITETIDKVKTSLRSINDEIKYLVDGAVIGDFSRHGNADKYQYEFHGMVSNLNQLMQTCETNLNDVIRILSALAEGDLTQKITREYQGMFATMKDNANVTVGQLASLVRQIKDAIGLITIASKEIADGNFDLSQRTEEQAANLEETVASMEELTSTVKQNADNARQGNQLAASASDMAVKGEAVVEQVVETMSAINDSSREIVDIINVIDGIAFQTNILALNAAVEAARAGEQGRGFAVVATEVRTLAQRSAAAAREIKELINNSVLKVEDGIQLVDQAGKTMDEVAQSIKRVTDIMGEISAASHGQSLGIEQINQAIAQVDKITRQNTVLVEQAAAASESMREQVDRLSRTVAAFTLEPSSSQPMVERRGPNRATNVERLSQAKNNRKAASSGLSAPKLTGTDGDWEEF